VLVSIGLTLQGIFLNFQEHFLCIYSSLVFKKLFFTVLLQQTNSSLLKVFAINILLSERKSSQIGQAANSLRVVPYSRQPAELTGYFCDINVCIF